MKRKFGHGGRTGAVSAVPERGILRRGDKFFATPLWANIQEGLASIGVAEDLPKTIRIVRMPQSVAQAMGGAAYLVLDASVICIGDTVMARKADGRLEVRRLQDGCQGGLLQFAVEPIN